MVFREIVLPRLFRQEAEEDGSRLRAGDRGMRMYTAVRVADHIGKVIIRVQLVRRFGRDNGDIWRIAAVCVGEDDWEVPVGAACGIRVIHIADHKHPAFFLNLDRQRVQIPVIAHIPGVPVDLADGKGIGPCR